MNFLTSLFIGTAKAADPIEIGHINFASGTNVENLKTVVANLIEVLFYVAGAAAIIFFIYSGIMYISSAGNPESAKKGSQGLLYATIGIIVVALSYYLVTAIAAWAAQGTLRPTP